MLRKNVPSQTLKEEVSGRKDKAFWVDEITCGKSPRKGYLVASGRMKNRLDEMGGQFSQHRRLKFFVIRAPVSTFGAVICLLSWPIRL